MTRLAAILWVCCLVLMCQAAALAQPAEEDAAAAVALARDAKEKYDTGDWAGARALFEAAEAKAHSPVIALYIARCHRNEGRLLRARDLYQHVADEALAPDAPEPFVAAQADARQDLKTLEPRIPRVRFVGMKAGATVELDGAPLPRADLPLAIDPGAHVAVAGEARAEFVAVEGKTSTVRLEVRAKAPARKAEPVTPDVETQGSVVPGAVLLGLGAAGLAAAVATRVVAFEKVADVKDRCVDGHCLAEDEAEIDTAKTLETVSTVCFAVGGAAAAVGIVLLIVRPGGSQTAVRIGPTSIGVAAVF